MSHTAIDERMLTGLAPARRNRYYYGKMLDVFHLSMEQRYVLAKQWLYNRAVLGPGVGCGLGVEPIVTPDGTGLLIRSGLAFDHWGREIVVPDDITLVPLAVTDHCGAPVPGSLPSAVTVQICYAECQTDFAPALVTDPSCGCGDDCEAGTVVETFCLRVVPGTAPPVTEPCLDLVKDGLAAGDLHGVLCALSKTCAPTVDDPCLTLANVSVAPDGALIVDDCGPRIVAPTNQILAQLLRCLIECCDGGEHPPPPAQLLRIAGVRLLASRGNDPATPNLPQIAALAPPSDEIMLPPEPFADVLEIRFDPAVTYDPASVVLGSSLIIEPPFDGDMLIPMTDAVRVHRRHDVGFSRGRSRVTVLGGPAGAPAVASTAGTRLDGEFPATGGPGWRSGDGTEGGDFRFHISVP